MGENGCRLIEEKHEACDAVKRVEDEFFGNVKRAAVCINLEFLDGPELCKLTS